MPEYRYRNPDAPKEPTPEQIRIMEILWTEDLKAFWAATREEEPMPQMKMPLTMSYLEDLIYAGIARNQ